MSFCLNDGAPLLSVGDTPSPSFDPSATIPYTPPKETSPTPSGGYQPPSYPRAGWTPGQQAAPPKKTNWLPWVLGGGALLLFLGIGLTVAFLVLVSIASNSNTSNTKSNYNQGNRKATTSNSNDSNNQTTTTSRNTPVLKEDFSSWWTGTINIGSARNEDGTYYVRANSGGYMAVYSPDRNDYYSRDTTVKVTAQSVTGVSPRFGYGLIMHGQMRNDQLHDYAFLIFTGETAQYKIVIHQNGSETPVVNWTASSLIQSGTSSNELEVRASGEKLEFYINGQYATTIYDTANFASQGRVGVYTSDLAETAFENLEIYK